MSERHLAIAVRDRIRAHADFDDKHVNCEWDERAPSTVPDLYIVVTSAGFTRGPLHQGGDAKDRLYAIDIHVMIRATSVPRDRERKLWIADAESLGVIEAKIEGQIDFDYTTINNANTAMIADGEATGTCDEFIEPLRWEGTGPIRAGAAGVFAGRIGEDVAALVRTLRYRDARRIITRS